MESAGELSHNNPKRKNGFGYGCLIIYMSLTPLPVTLALSFLKTESLDPPPCRLGSLDSFDLVWEKKGSVLFWPSVQERLVTSWLLKHPSPSLKKRRKKTSQGLEKAVRWNFHSFQCQLLSWCSVSQNYVVQILPSFLTGALGTDVFNHQSCKSHVTRNCDVKGGRKGNSLMSLNNILQYILQIWGLFVSI